MENNRNLFITIILSVVILGAWQIFYIGPKIEAEKQAQLELQAQQETTTTGPSATTSENTSLPQTTAETGAAAPSEGDGVAEAAASAIVGLGAGSPWLTLALVYTVTSILTQFITNNAAAVLVLPFALTSASVLGANPMPFVIATMMAASASFATPFGYQTNLMVYGAGGYTFQDFLRIGVPMNVVCGVLIILLTPYFFPF